MLQQNSAGSGCCRKNIRVIGLTGGIASGKSAVASFLKEHGVTVIDADELSREAVRPGTPCLEKIIAVFGSSALLPDGTLDRKRIGSIVFSDSGKRKLLEQIIHPEIRRIAEDRISAAAATGQRLLFYMAPLLIESGACKMVDEIWVVTVTPEVQLERLINRDNASMEEAERIIATQMPLDEKERFGKIVIDNSGTLDDLRRQLSAIWNKEIGVMF